MDGRYTRNLGALTPAECALLRTKRVFVAGCGGLGGYLIEHMLRLGVGAVTAADGDVFEESNLNRQLLSEIPLIGKSKAQAAKERAMRVNPEVEFTAIDSFIDGNNAVELIRGADVVLDGLDNIKSRRVLSKACEKLGLPLVHGAIRGWNAQAAVSMPGDGLLERIYPESAAVTDKSALSFTPALCASVQAALCAALLCGRPVQTGRLYLFDLLSMDFDAVL